MDSLKGKKALIFGVANEKSIAWGIAQALHAQGVECGFTYLNESMKKRVEPLAQSLDAKIIVPCDVQDEDQVKAVFKEVDSTWGGFDILVHSLAFANREDLQGRFYETSRDGFLMAMEVSAYSLVLLAKHAYPQLKASKGSILTLTYLGAERVVPNYNVMGVAKACLEASVKYLAADLGPDSIRVNAISAGPIRTLAASGIKGFRDMLSDNAEKTPLRRNMDLEDIGKTAVYLASDLSSGVTGEILYVDGGYHIMGM